MGRAKENSARAAEDMDMERDMLRVTIDVRFWPLVNSMFCVKQGTTFQPRTSVILRKLRS